MSSSFVPSMEANTEQVPASQRLDFWDAHNASALIGLRCSTLSPLGLNARERNLDLGLLRLADISGNEHVIERAPGMLKTHPKESLFACLLLEGRAFFYQSAQCIQLRAGDAILYPTTLPYLYGFTGQMRQILIDIDSDRLQEHRRPQNMQAPIKIDASLRAGQLFVRELRSTALEFLASPLSQDAKGAASRMQTLLQGLLNDSARSGRSSESWTIRLLRAENFIAKHIDDPLLDAASVANHLHVSVRQLDRAFMRREYTVTQWIWKERLARAREGLADPGQRAATIGEIALRWGFSTQAHFASCFKATYAMTPSQYRQLEQSGVTSDGFEKACTLDGGRKKTPALRTGS